MNDLDLIARSRDSANKLRKHVLQATFVTPSLRDRAYTAAAHIEALCDDIQTLRASLLKSDPAQAHTPTQEDQGAAAWAAFAEKCRQRDGKASTLTHRTTCIIACHSMIVDMQNSQARLNSELQTRVTENERHERVMLRERIASLDRDIAGMRASIAWLDRMPMAH